MQAQNKQAMACTTPTLYLPTLNNRKMGHFHQQHQMIVLPNVFFCLVLGDSLSGSIVLGDVAKNETGRKEQKY